ncbi:MAG: alginate export family protein [Candidatus Latescibacterota bacterium]|nr:MAG: alginate export family protein [Candidatus Latescibacterota bacterium]
MRAWILVAVAAFTLTSSLVGSTPVAADTEIDVDGQVRLRLEAWNFDRGSALTQGRLLRTDTRHVVLQRARFGLRARVSPDVTAYILAQDARTWGATGTLSLLRNLDVHQAWGEVRHRFDKTSLRVRGGRQKLSYGIERIIGGLEWANPARAFDALKVEVRRSIWTLDLDAARVLQSGQSQSLVTGRDQPVLRGLLAGNDDVFVAHNRFDIPDMTLHVDAYGMYRDTDPQTVVWDTLLNDSPAAAVITPGIYETTLGEHVAGTFGRWRFDQEFAYMFGKRFERGVTPLTSADLRSFLFSAQVHVRVAERLKPTLGVGFDFLSGDAVKGDGKNELFSIARIFHTGHKFYGLMDVAPFLAGAAGLVDPYGRIGISGPRGLRAQAVVHVFSVDKPARQFEDLEEFGAKEARSYLGTEVDATVSWLVASKTRLELGGGVFTPGDTLKETGSGDTVYWGYLQGLLAF